MITEERAEPVTTKISRENQEIAQYMTDIMNKIALTRAMQEGYAMACRDNGLTIPEMEDPRTALGFGS